MASGVVEAAGDTFGHLKAPSWALRPFLRAVDAGELKDLVRTFPSGPVHIHAAEQMPEVEECVAWSGAARRVAARHLQWTRAGA
jgi:cytosine/adenosine deaminase-related metal-dependent hydrolase